nr:hypothetical protein [Blautia sp. OF11-22]
MKKAEVKKGKKKNALKEYWPLYLMMLPALLYLLINNYIPMAGMVIAFKKLNFAKGIWQARGQDLKISNSCLLPRMHGLLQEIRCCITLHLFL